VDIGVIKVRGMHGYSAENYDDARLSKMNVKYVVRAGQMH
jgi:hypothetical protein